MADSSSSSKMKTEARAVTEAPHVFLFNLPMTYSNYHLHLTDGVPTSRKVT